jgi:hypothetical protein
VVCSEPSARVRTTRSRTGWSRAASTASKDWALLREIMVLGMNAFFARDTPAHPRAS